MATLIKRYNVSSKPVFVIPNLILHFGILGLGNRMNFGTLNRTKMPSRDGRLRGLA